MVSVLVDMFQRKNYYFVQTMLEEITHFDVISFNLFDTLLLREVLFPRDIWRIVAEQAEQQFGIVDFHYVRENVENEIRAVNGTVPVTLHKIYEEIGRRYPQWPMDALMQMELEVEHSCLAKNPLIYQIFQAALVAGKKVLLISDEVQPASFFEAVLNDLQCSGYHKLYLSTEWAAPKHTGDLYRTILEQEQLEPGKWLHIGNDPGTDLQMPRQLHITAAAYCCPRDCYFRNRTEEHAKAEEEAGGPVIEEPLDPSIAFSRETAKSMNALYTEVLAPGEEVVISVDDVSMMFNMSSEKVDSIKEYVIRFLKRQLKFKEFWALHDISFSVRRGEKLGLIGLNGSGKSTMLKIVSGVLKATKGKVRVVGSIAPLIELGAGFDFELSARENIFLNGAILGYSREEMKQRYDDIIDFAELRDFENVAIKNFSSGMIARLGFAIATCHVPDILIIDEILSVGDFAFQKKCHRKMKELTQCGTTVLFVSHSAGDIISMCDRAVWLDHGYMLQEGQAQYIVEKYISQ